MGIDIGTDDIPEVISFSDDHLGADELPDVHPDDRNLPPHILQAVINLRDTGEF